MTTAINDPAAHNLLRTAHDAGYRFPEGFNGFTANVRLVVDSPEESLQADGTATIGGPRATSVEIDASESAKKWLNQELASMAGHRWPTPYEQSDGRWTLSVEDDSAGALGQLIRVHDDPFESSYRLREGRISQVHRQMGPMRFTITIQSHTSTSDGRFLPATFTVSYWSLDNQRLTRADAYVDTYQEVQQVLVPQSRKVVTATDAGFEARELTVTNVAFLRDPVAAPDGPAEYRTR